MSQYLSTSEEFSVMRKFQYPQTLSLSKENLALTILSRPADEILLIYPSGFTNAALISGLSEKQIEFFAKNAPAEYKKNIFDTLTNSLYMKDILENARLMDENTGNKNSQHQQRIQNVIQYIKDNQLVFQF